MNRKLFLLVGLVWACSADFSPEDLDGDVDALELTVEGEEDPSAADSEDPGLELDEDVVETDPEEEEVDPCDLYPTWYRDFDMDGYGRDDATVCAVVAPATYVARGGDCCDGNVDVNPDQPGWFTEPYNCPTASFDYNCDGTAEQEHALAGCGDDTYCDGYAPESVCESQPGCWRDRSSSLPCGESAPCVGCMWSHGYVECMFAGPCPTVYGIVSPYTMACR